MDYLVNREATNAELKDKAMLARLREIEQLESEEKQIILHVVDSLLRDANGGGHAGI